MTALWLLGLTVVIALLLWAIPAFPTISDPLSRRVTREYVRRHGGRQ